MKSGFDPASYNWNDEYYQVSLRDLHTTDFVQGTFTTKPGLVARSPQDGYTESSEYVGQPFDSGKHEVVPDHWDHEHCTVCRFRIEPGHTYWESRDTVWLLCDVCHDYVMRRADPGEQPA